MKVFTLAFFTFLILTVCGGPAVFGQTQPDSAAYHAAVDNAVLLHDQAVHDQLPLYNGYQHVNYPNPFAEGSPYYGTARFEAGTITYDHLFFDSVSLLYDDLADQVIARLGVSINLIADKISSFSITTHQFVKLDKGSGIDRPGFYEVLEQGRATLLKKTRKKISDRLIIHEQAQSGLKVDIVNQYYVQRQKQLFKVSGRNDLLELLGDQQQALKQFIRKNSIHFDRNHYETSLMSTVAFYNSLQAQ